MRRRSSPTSSAACASSSVTGSVLADPNVLSYVWIREFPMYQWDAENHRWDATHNPFSGVLPSDEVLLTTLSGDPLQPSPDDPAGRARATQYDLALNGWELGGGSVRIHRRELLERSFLLQGHSLEAQREKFGAVLEAVRVRRAAPRRESPSASTAGPRCWRARRTSAR
jgi:aspartyl-tRNA synthetase